MARWWRTSGIGYAPDSWSSLADALGTSSRLRERLVKTGLIARKDDDAKARYYGPLSGARHIPD